MAMTEPTAASASVTGAPLRIAVFASGEGTNAENIIRHCRRSEGRAEVALVVCNRPGAGVLRRAAELATECAVISRSQLENAGEMLPLLERHGVDAIALAGFLLMVPSYLVSRYRGRIFNIHPSLLPKYGGKGMYGRHVHEAVVAAGESVSGITVHMVSEECDGGSILFQASVPVDPSDTAADLERKIHSLEAAHYPQVILEALLGEEAH